MALYEFCNLPWRDTASGALQTGQVSLRMEIGSESRLDFYNCGETNLPAYLVYIVFRVLLGEGWIDKLEKLHRNRREKWTVEITLNTHDAKKYQLFSVGRDRPVCSSAISVSNGQIDTFSIRSEDAAPLLKKVIEEYPPVFFPKFRKYRYTYNFPTHMPGFVSRQTFTELPEPIKKQREETQRIEPEKGFASAGVFQAGETSGIIETIEALKCMEVLLV